MATALVTGGAGFIGSNLVRALPTAAFFAVVAAGWIFVAIGTWNAIGIVAGIPLDAVMWLGFGLAVVALEVS